MTSSPPPAPRPRPAPPLQANLEHPLRIEGPHETRVLTIGPVGDAVADAVIVLGVVLVAVAVHPQTRVVLRWRVLEPLLDRNCTAAAQVCRFEGSGEPRILAALDRDDIPRGFARTYALTAQLEGQVLFAVIREASARAGPLSPVSSNWAGELVDRCAGAAAAEKAPGR